MSPALQLERVRTALLPLDVVPDGPPWNLHELDGLPLPAQPTPAAVLVGLVANPAGVEVLLTRRTEQMRHHAGQVSFPGGSIEPSDLSPAAAALREAEEEIGLAKEQAQLLGYLDPLLTVSGFRVQPTVVQVDAGFQAKPEPNEVAEVFRVPLALLMDPARLENIQLQFGGRVRHVLQYRYSQQRIWGVTASILYNLRQRLDGASQWRV